MNTNTELIEKLNIKEYIQAADRCLAAMQFTEHNLAHLTRVAEATEYILRTLGYDEHTLELAKIASYMHDIGNVVNRCDHGHSSALLCHSILLSQGYELSDVLKVMSAVGNHDERTGEPVSVISAALILADKSDVRRSRVRKQDITMFNIHDKVNYAVYDSNLSINLEEKTIALRIELDTEFSSILDYLEIYSGRMVMCRKAAKYLGLNFKLVINGVELID